MSLPVRVLVFAHFPCFHYLFELHRPGILADVAERVASRGMSLEDVSTSLRLTKDGQREFVIDALASSPNLADKENLEVCIADIMQMEEEFQLTHFDVRVHTA